MRVSLAPIPDTTPTLLRSSPEFPVASTGAVFLRPGGTIAIADDLRVVATGPRRPPVRRLKAIDSIQIPTSSRIFLRAGVAIIR